MRSIEKASGGGRAIAATSTFYAIYGAIKAQELELWRASHSGFWGTALKGSSSLRAAVERVMKCGGGRRRASQENGGANREMLEASQDIQGVGGSLRQHSKPGGGSRLVFGTATSSSAAYKSK